MEERRGGALRRVLLVATCTTALLVAVACSQQSTGAGAKIQPKKGPYTIALSNSFLGNSWRQTMVKVFQHTAGEAKDQGLVKDFKVSNTSQNTATEQIAQMKSLILQKPDAILVNSASPTALNPVITQACNAGIVVVVFDSLASAPCEYDVQDDLTAYGTNEGQAVAEAMGGKGNLVLVRGVVGSEPEAKIYAGQKQALSKYPDIHIVKELVGQASNSVTQQVVQSALPSLPKIDGVITGGSSLGALQAFKAAGRPLPKVAFDNTGDSLNYWKQLSEQSGYQAVSVRTEPGQAAAAVWVAIDLLQGKKVPKKLTLPDIVIKPDTLDAWMKVTPAGNAATWLWSKDQVDQAITDNQNGKTVAAPPVPTDKP